MALHMQMVDWVDEVIFITMAQMVAPMVDSGEGLVYL
jgi:hypothetical protein